MGATIADCWLIGKTLSKIADVVNIGRISSKDAFESSVGRGSSKHDFPRDWVIMQRISEVTQS